jgi:hypothetical protein
MVGATDKFEDPIELPSDRKLITPRDAAPFHSLDYKNLYFNGSIKDFAFLQMADPAPCLFCVVMLGVVQCADIRRSDILARRVKS